MNNKCYRGKSYRVTPIIQEPNEILENDTCETLINIEKRERMEIMKEFKIKVIKDQIITEKTPNSHRHKTQYLPTSVNVQNLKVSEDYIINEADIWRMYHKYKNSDYVICRNILKIIKGLFDSGFVYAIDSSLKYNFYFSSDGMMFGNKVAVIMSNIKRYELFVDSLKPKIPKISEFKFTPLF